MKQTIKNQLQLIYDGDPWYGSSMKTVLESINPKIIFDSPGNGMHSIVELAAHMLAYRKFTNSAYKAARMLLPGKSKPLNGGIFQAIKRRCGEL